MVFSPWVAQRGIPWFYATGMTVRKSDSPATGQIAIVEFHCPTSGRYTAPDVGGFGAGSSAGRFGQLAVCGHPGGA